MDIRIFFYGYCKQKKTGFSQLFIQYFCVFYTKYSYENSLEENPNVAERERQYCHGSQSENSTDLDSSRRAFNRPGLARVKSTLLAMKNRTE